jgi:Uma2 family endonuclease
MMEGSITVACKRRGSIWGPDGRYYPATEERDVPLSGAALRLIFYLYAGLRRLLYPQYTEVYVAADQFIYYVPHEPTKKVAPDVWVCYGVPKQPERDVFRTWEEGATPSFVVEVSSEDSRPGDRGAKFEMYRDTLQCREYLIYDEDLDELLLYRREGGVYQPVLPAPDGRLYSQELRAWFGREPGVLVRIYDVTGEPISDPEETAERAEVLERIRQHLEEETAELAGRLEAAHRRAEDADRKAEELATEIARLREENARLRSESREEGN